MIKSILSSRLVLALVLSLFVGSVYMTYHRAFISQDYKIFYEAPCDPLQQNCFVVSCEDAEAAECTDYYFLKIERDASDLAEHCGSSVVDCTYAATCSDVSKPRCVEHYCEEDHCEQTG